MVKVSHVVGYVDVMKDLVKDQLLANQPNPIHQNLLVFPTSLHNVEKTRFFWARFKGILCEVPFLGGSALLLFYSVGVMASCNYIPQIMIINVF